MRPNPDTALSETVMTILLIILVVALAAVIVMIVMGVPIFPSKPVFAAFRAETVMGADRGNPSVLDVPVIRLSQIAGAPLSQDYTEGGHSAINGTRIKLRDPDGKLYTAVTADSMTGKTLEKGESFYIFHYHTSASEDPWIWITNDNSRISGSPGVEPFHPSGTWKLVITDEKDTTMVIYEQSILL
jgi:hypothetical protein